MTRRPDSQDRARRRRSHTPSPGWRPCKWRPLFWADLRLLWDYTQVLEEKITEIEEKLVNVQEYAAAVDAETNRLAGIVAELKTEVENSDATNAAELAAAFDPVLEHLRGVGVSGPTEPPAPEDGETEPSADAPADGS